MAQNNASLLAARGREDGHKLATSKPVLIVGPRPHPDVLALAAAGLLTIREDPSHFLYDPRADGPVDTDLAASIVRSGQLQNIRIKRDGDEYIVVLGRQRLKALAWLNLQARNQGAAEDQYLVTASVYKSDEDGSFIAMTDENNQRTEETPMQKARKMALALNRGMKPDEVGASFKVKGQMVKLMVKLLDLSGEAQRAVDAGELSVTTAVHEFTKLSAEDQRGMLATMREAGATKGMAAKEVIKEAKAGRVAAPRDTEGPRLAVSAKKMDIFVKRLAVPARESEFMKGVRAAFQYATGGNPKDFADVRAILEGE